MFTISHRSEEDLIPNTESILTTIHWIFILFKLESLKWLKLTNFLEGGGRPHSLGEEVILWVLRYFAWIDF
jgi:hypothetical protein